MRSSPVLLLLPIVELASCGAPKGSNNPDAMSENAAAAGDHMAMGGQAMGKERKGAPSMSLALKPAGPFAVGRSQAVALMLTDLATGKSMGPDDMAVAHTKKLHLLIIDGSLSDYQHIHPQYDPSKPGTWRFDFAPRFGRTYKVWADVTRPNGGQEYVGTEMVAGDQPAPKPSSAVATKAAADGLIFSLSFSGPLKVGQGAQGSIAIADGKTGQPFAGLQPIMGAFGHIVAFAGNWNSIEHVHPLGAEPTLETERGGPVIRFHIKPEQAGTLKLFAQIRANGRETIVPFTLTVQR